MRATKPDAVRNFVAVGRYREALKVASRFRLG